MNPLKMFSSMGRWTLCVGSALISGFAVVFLTTLEAAAQRNPQPLGADSSVPVPENYTWWYVALGILILGLAGAIVWWRNEQSAKKTVETGKNNKSLPAKKTQTAEKRASVRATAIAKGKKGASDADVDKWLQATYSPADANGSSTVAQTAAVARSQVATPVAAVQSQSNATNVANNGAAVSNGANNSNSWQLSPPRAVEKLPDSDDDSLLEAIEQIHEDEDDEMMRGLALRVLSAFKTQNSVDALEAVALYDQSAKVRIEAINALGAFDHEAVFEPILLACADPAREVRAAAARTLSGLNFDRADAFVRVVESRDAERMRLASLACVETGLAGRAFERLTAPDAKQSYEAFAIVTLLVKAGEFAPILEALETNPNIHLRLSLIRVLHNLNPTKMLPDLEILAEKNVMTAEVKTALNELIFHLKQML